MAHFAELDENNIVVTVIVVDNDKLLNKDGKESEQIGLDYIASIGLEGTYVQTSINNNFRKQYASVGMIYDPVLDEFIEPITEEPTID